LLSPEALEQSVQAAKADPQTQQSAHEHFAAMWKVLDEEAHRMVIEELQSEPPPNDKQN
jgi:hypothetical protein